MTRYRIIFALLLVGIYFAYKQMQSVYKNIPTSPTTAVNPSSNNGPGQRLKDHSIENFYYIIVDRFSDGDKSNNKDIDLYNNLAFHGGDLKGIEKNLTHLKDLGITSLILSSLQLQKSEPQILNIRGEELTRYPFDGSNPVDLEEFDPHFGTKTDLKELTNSAHKLGLKVYMKYNMVQIDNTSAKVKDPEYKKYLSLYSPECKPGQFDELTTCVYRGKVRFNHESKEFQEYAINVLRNLKADTNIDGLFLDSSRHLPESFIDAIEKVLDSESQMKSFRLIYSLGTMIHAFQQERFKSLRSDYLYDNSLTSRLEYWIQKNQESEEWINSFNVLNQNETKQNQIIDLASDNLRSLKIIYKNDMAKIQTHLAIWAFSSANLFMNYGEEYGILNDSFPFYYQNMPWEDSSIAIDARPKTDKVLLETFKRILNYRTSNNDFYKAKISVAYQTDEAIIFEKVLNDKAIAYLAVNLTGTKQNVFYQYKTLPKNDLGTNLLNNEKLSAAGQDIIFNLEPFAAQFVVF